MHEVKAALVATGWNAGAWLASWPLAAASDCRVHVCIPVVLKPLLRCRWAPEAALEELRTRGHNAASKKVGVGAAALTRGAVLTALLLLLATQASRLAAEGLVGVASAGNVGVVVELNSETDFVARNPKFQVLTCWHSRTVLVTP
jgi:translation elongation factor EF-Ts